MNLKQGNINYWEDSGLLQSLPKLHKEIIVSLFNECIGLVNCEKDKVYNLYYIPAIRRCYTHLLKFFNTRSYKSSDIKYLLDIKKIINDIDTKFDILKDSLSILDSFDDDAINAEVLALISLNYITKTKKEFYSDPNYIENKKIEIRDSKIEKLIC